MRGFALTVGLLALSALSTGAKAQQSQPWLGDRRMGGGIGVRAGDFEWKVLSHPRARLREGEKVYLRFDMDHVLAVRP